MAATGMTMACLVSSLVAALPKAHAFVGGGVRSLSKSSTSTSRLFSTTATATAYTSNFTGRSPLAVCRHRAGWAVIATTTPTTTTAVFTRGLTGSPPALLMSGSTGDGMETAAAADAGGAKHVLVPVADGSEEIESVTIIDTLVRAGAVVTVASVGDDVEVTCSRGVRIKADCKIADCEPRDWDAVVCPGGMPGAVHLKESETLEAILRKQISEGRVVAAICAAPAVVLASHGLLDGKKATCYPAGVFTDKIPQLVDEKVVVDGNLITSQGPATSMAFALQLVEALFGEAKAKEIGGSLLFK